MSTERPAVTAPIDAGLVAAGGAEYAIDSGVDEGAEFRMGPVADTTILGLSNGNGAGMKFAAEGGPLEFSPQPLRSTVQ